MRKVWAVSSGSYSDYGVECLFTTKELAEEHIEQRNRGESSYDETFVEEFALLDYPPRRYPVHTKCGVINSKGGVEAERVWTSYYWDYQDVLDGSIYQGRVKVEQTKHFGGGIRIWAQGMNIEKVEKAYQDRVAQVRAEVMGAA